MKGKLVISLDFELYWGVRDVFSVASMMTYSEMLGMKIPMMQKVKAAINYWRFAFCAEHRSVKAPLWTWLVMPVGYAMHIRDRRNNL